MLDSMVDRPRLVLGSIAAAVLLVLSTASCAEPPVYAVDVETLVLHPERFGSKKIRLEGVLVEGSCVRQASPCEYRFRLRGREQTIEVRFPQCRTPEFTPLNLEVSVVAEGHLARDGSYFDANLILARGGGKYEIPPRPTRPICP
jgi:cytochrome c-type biogenesis protein CcmE